MTKVECPPSLAPMNAAPEMSPRQWRNLPRVLSQRPLLLIGIALSIVLLFPRIPEALTWPARAFTLALLLLAAGGITTNICKRPKHFVFSAIALLLGAGFAYGMLEALSAVWLKTTQQSAADPFRLTDFQRESLQRMLDDAPDYYVISPTLGWVPGKNRTSEDGLAKTNAASFRANREYDKAKPANVTRVICFGDSYVHCDEVGNAETWPHFAELSQPTMEFLNFGVGGYGVTQSFVRYQETAAHYQADVAILGCMTDDLRRSLNVYYPFRLANPADAPSPTAMPYASLDERGGLVIHSPVLSSRNDYLAFLDDPRPKLKEMARLDPLFKPSPATPLLALVANRWATDESSAVAAGARYFQTAASRTLNLRDGTRHRSAEQRLRERIYTINCAIFERFAETAKQAGHLPLVVWFPSPKDLENHNNGKKRSYQRYLEHLRRNHISFVDTLDWLGDIYGNYGKLPISEILKTGHFSAATNQRIGERVAAHVRQMIQSPLPTN